MNIKREILSPQSHLTKKNLQNVKLHVHLLAKVCRLSFSQR